MRKCISMKTRRKRKQEAETGRRQETESGTARKAAELLIAAFVILILGLSVLTI